jgi:hypothetical protein
MFCFFPFLIVLFVSAVDDFCVEELFADDSSSSSPRVLRRIRVMPPGPG